MILTKEFKFRCSLVPNLDSGPGDRGDLAPGIQRESSSQGSRGTDAERIRQPNRG